MNRRARRAAMVEEQARSLGLACRQCGKPGEKFIVFDDGAYLVALDKFEVFCCKHFISRSHSRTLSPREFVVMKTQSE